MYGGKYTSGDYNILEYRSSVKGTPISVKTETELKALIEIALTVNDTVWLQRLSFWLRELKGMNKI